MPASSTITRQPRTQRCTSAGSVLSITGTLPGPRPPAVDEHGDAEQQQPADGLLDPQPHREQPGQGDDDDDRHEHHAGDDPQPEQTLPRPAGRAAGEGEGQKRTGDDQRGAHPDRVGHHGVVVPEKDDREQGEHGKRGVAAGEQQHGPEARGFGSSRGHAGNARRPGRPGGSAVPQRPLMTFVIGMSSARSWESALTACYKGRVTTHPPSAPPTLEDVARVAGVSRATVSRVVNSVRNVDPKLRETVERAIATTGYVPNRAARSLVTRRTGGVALVVSEPERHVEAFTGGGFGDPFFGRVVEGVVAHLRPQGLHPLLMLVDSDEEREKLVPKLRQEQVSGVLLISLHPAEDPLPRMLTDAGVPTALFARPGRPAPVSYVDVAHQDGARLAADRLVSRGCHRVATIAGPAGTPAGQDRLAGFRDAMARHGHAYVAVAEGDFTEHGGERAMERLLAEEPALDGLFVANDLMAYGALTVLREAGRRVPGDVAVIGFDDSRVALSCRPRLTTVRQPVEEMGAAMARMVLDRMADPDGRAESVIFDPELVVRDSA